MRARLFQERGLIDVLDPREATAKNLADRIMVDLERTDFPSSNAAIDTTGARNAADRLLELALERPSLQPMALSRSGGTAGRGTDLPPLRGSAIKSNRTSPRK